MAELKPQSYRAISSSLVLLLLTVLALAGYTLGRGPQLQNVTYNSAQLTSMPGQQAALQFNEPLREITELTMTPTAQFETEILGSQLRLTFAQPLLAATTYQLRVTAVSQSTGKAHTVTTALPTDALQVFGLGSSAPGQDSLTLHRVGADPHPQNPAAVFNAAHITEFAVSSNWIAALQPGDNFEQRLTVLRLDGTGFTELPQPATAAPRMPQFSADGSLLGIKFFNGTADNLWLYTLNNLSRTAVRPVTDAGGVELEVAEWWFEPGSSTVLLRTPEGVVYRAPFGAPATPATAADSTSHNSLAATAWDASATDTFLNGTADLGGGSASPAHRTLASGDTLAVAADGTSLLLTSAGNSSTVFNTAAASSRITGFCLSPNQQYAAVLISPAGGTAQAQLIELPSGKVAASFLARTVSWCNN